MQNHGGGLRRQFDDVKPTVSAKGLHFRKQVELHTRPQSQVTKKRFGELPDKEHAVRGNALYPGLETHPVGTVLLRPVSEKYQ